ncbi:hypothetical protein DR950_18265 [Kitasatospora xanthocidica]|uniref:Uncharacterized protein n=1 Tax=Kitasatospora xanthocidica TaxID=83382 RepID=A0A372ZUB7_9ACTN|nr:hypothetical protein [Kitasatospora xanthocidica]RGD59479.1 hypothetical protein DR950_18265 [Kitasatospora xanthocidica]
MVNSNGLTVDLESEGHRSILPRITVPISTLVAPRARNLRELQASEKSNGRAEEPLDPVAFDPDQVLDRMSAAGVADLAVSTEDIVETVRSVRRDDQ